MFEIPTFCLVTDRRRLSPHARTTGEELDALEGAIVAAADAGIDVVQIRERDLDAATLRSFVARVVRRISSMRARVVVNDRVDVAIAAGAHGVHLRADGPAIPRVRAAVPAEWIVGRSAHSAEEIGLHPGADYFIFGTVFPSASKGAGAPTQHRAGLADAARAADVPVWAIGGITPATAADCLAAGARGIAAIGAFLDGGSEANVVAARVGAMRRAIGGSFGKQVQ